MRRKLVQVVSAAVGLSLLTPACGTESQVPARQRSASEVPALPGARLTLLEIVRANPSVGEGFNYRLQAAGLPPGKAFRLEVRRLDGQVGRMPIETLHVDAAGQLVTERGFRLEQHVLGTGPVLKGEPLEPALVAEDGSGEVVARMVPAPIAASGVGGCHLSIELADPTGNVFLLRGEGFEPREEVRTTSKSDGEVLPARTTASETGEIRLIVLPAVIGKAGGSASYSASGRVCTVTLSYEWGAAMEPA